MQSFPRSLLLILLLTFAVFAPSLANGFAMDDAPLAQSVDAEGRPDEIIVGMRAPWWYFGQRYWAGVDNYSALYRPVTVFSFALIYNWIGAWLPASWEAFPQHLANVLLHCLAVYLVWWMLRDLGRGELAALLGSGVFAFHAIHSEVVAGIVGRAELQSFCFGLWGTLLFARGGTLRAGLLFFLAFCSKESGLAWGPFLPCYLWTRQRLLGAPAPEGLWSTHGMGVVRVLGLTLLAFFVLRWIGLRDLPEGNPYSYAQNPLAHVELAPRLLTAVKLLGYGLGKCVAPFWLYSLYGPGAIAVVESPGDPGFLAAGAVLLLWLLAGLVLARRMPLLFLSAAAFLGFSFLTSNIPLVIGTIFGERLFYMPSLGVCLLPVILVSSLGRRGRRILLVTLGIWCLASSGVILARNGAWKDNMTLYVGDADRLPRSADLQAKAGFSLEDVDQDRAIAYFERSVAADANLAGSWMAIGRIHRHRGDYRKAAEHYSRALGTRFVATSGVEDYTIDQYLEVLAMLREHDTLFEFCRKTVARKPDHYLARAFLIEFGWKRMEKQELSRVIREGIARKPGAAMFILQETLFLLEHEKDVARDSREIVERLEWSLANIRPAVRDHDQQIRARLHLGRLQARLGRKAAALRSYRSLLSIRTLTPAVRRALEAELGKFSDNK